MSSYMFTPPTYRFVEILQGSLRFGITTCTVVYRQGGQWHNLVTPGMDNPVIAQVDKLGDQLLYFDRPTPVDGSLYNELSALTPADPSWTPQTLVLLS